MVKKDFITLEDVRHHGEFEESKKNIETLWELTNRHETERRILMIKSWERAEGSPTHAASALEISRQRWMDMRKKLGLENYLPICRKGRGVSKEEEKTVKSLHDFFSRSLFRKNISPEVQV